MTTTTRTYETIHSVSASAVPGDTLRRLTRPVACADGTVLPRGTTYRAQSGGCDNTPTGRGRSYSDITVITMGR